MISRTLTISIERKVRSEMSECLAEQATIKVGPLANGCLYLELDSRHNPKRHKPSQPQPSINHIAVTYTTRQYQILAASFIFVSFQL
jgi:hypothetical protein